MKDKYISIKESISGLSFANLGLFTGFANGIIGAVYALVLFDIFQSSASVGIYVAIYSAFCMIVTLFINEFFRNFSKVKLFYISMLASAVMYFMMAFSIAPGTFISLDFASGIPQVLIGVLIPLFMADFSHNHGMAKLNGRYFLWLNIGALFAPMIAMTIASNFGNRAAFFAVAAVYAIGLFFFNRFAVVQPDKKIQKVYPRKTIRALWKNVVSFFGRADLTRAYIVNFGNHCLGAMKNLYVPLIVIEQGFSKDTLGMILTLGIIPYVLLSEPLGRLARKYGTRLWMVLGFVSFAALAFWASFASGWTLMAIFVLWQISGALMEPIRDLLFFDAVKKDEQSKYIGIFKTSSSIPKFIAPLIGAGFIVFFGGSYSVWIATAVIALLSTWVLIVRKA